MDEALVNSVIDRDWPPFTEQVRRLSLGEPERNGTRIDIPVHPPGTQDLLRAVLLCDDYDAQAPVLDFADLDDHDKLGGQFWPSIEGAPLNSIPWDGRQLPIICTPGTRGYHLHSSHVAEQHPPETWRLPKVASLLSWFLHMGPYKGRGV